VADCNALIEPVLDLQRAIRDAVLEATTRQEVTQLAHVDRDDEGDTIYRIDAVADTILEAWAHRLGNTERFVLIAEGLPGGMRTYPDGTDAEDARWRIIVDPIDGTRGIMYQKRSAWVLTGVAPNRGTATRVRDVELAAQTEIPTLKQHLSDQLWAVKGRGVTATRYDRIAGTSRALALTPSSATTIAHGYATVSRFFPGARDELAAIDEEVVLGALGPIQRGKAGCFEDQYACTGGQLYELMAGHDRFIADLRPLLDRMLATRGQELGICCHPYDICTALIATEAGVLLTDARGGTLDAPLTVEADVDWAGYANHHIRAQIEPLLLNALRRRGWI
jgi:fructose-1,6-bisphosphatase/inositol monophosphatase family enzyme